jgi:hypothetical protein
MDFRKWRVVNPSKVGIRGFERLSGYRHAPVWRKPASNGFSQKASCYPLEGRHPGFCKIVWIPACAGMTKAASKGFLRVASFHPLEGRQPAIFEIGWNPAEVYALRVLV